MVEEAPAPSEADVVDAEEAERLRDELDAQIELRNTLRAAFDAEGKASQQLLVRVMEVAESLRSREAKRHASAIEKYRSRSLYEKEIAHKKMEDVRTAGVADMQNRELQLEIKHADALTKVKEEVAEVHKMFESRLSAQREVEQKLLQKITGLDGGIAAAELEKQRYAEPSAEPPLHSGAAQPGGSRTALIATS